MRGLGDGFDDRLHARLEDRRHGELQRNGCQEQRGVSLGEIPPDERREGQRDHDRRANALHGAAKHNRRLRPAPEQARMHADTELVAHHRDLLAQIQVRRQFARRVLPRPDHVRHRRFEQPPRERLFAGMRPRRREQLEEAAAAENVQIFSVEMRRRRKVRAVAAAADPAMRQPIQAALVEGGGQSRPVACVQQPRVRDAQHRKGRKRHEQPDRAIEAANNKDADGHGEEGQSRVGVGGVRALARGQRLATRHEAHAVFELDVSRRHLAEQCTSDF